MAASNSKAYDRDLRLVGRVVLVEQDGILEVLLHRRHGRLKFVVPKIAHFAEV